MGVEGLGGSIEGGELILDVGIQIHSGISEVDEGGGVADDGVVCSGGVFTLPPLHIPRHNLVDSPYISFTTAVLFIEGNAGEASGSEGGSARGRRSIDRLSRVVGAVRRVKHPIVIGA